MSWVVLTMGDRPDQVDDAIASIRAQGRPSEIVVVMNGAGADAVSPEDADVVVRTAANLGVPDGRNRGAAVASQDIIGFLDDDATLLDDDTNDTLVRLFRAERDLAVVAFRILDERGGTARRHHPRVGISRPDQSGQVATFLGGACAIRRSWMDRAGGYWGELFYAHEELDLAWRMIDRGAVIRYRPDIRVQHPTTTIAAHADGWRRTGRNRVMIAKRNLPLPVATVHVVAWAALGALRAPTWGTKKAYVAGLAEGLRSHTPRRSMSWSTVKRLTELRRPPVL